MTSQTISPALRRLRLAGSSAWRPKLERRLSDYCCETVKLSPEWEASRGAYNLAENPFWEDILDAMVDPEVREISVCKSTRVGGTLALIAAILGMSHLDPGPAMVVTPDEPSAIELRDRIYDTASASRPYVNQVPPRRLWNTRRIDLQSNQVFMAWAGSAQRLRGRTCRRVFFSETDVYPPALRGGGNAIRAGGERIKRSYYNLRYYESSPDGDPSTIHELYLRGNQQKWHCPCPKCGRYQELRFFTQKDGPDKGKGGIAGYRDDNGNLLSVEEALDSAHYVCLSGCKIENHQKNKMVEAGVWVPKGCHVNDETGEIMGTPERSKRHTSCHLWTVHVPRINFSGIAAAYIDHYVTNDLKEFFQNWLGWKYRTGRKPPSWDIVGKRYESYHKRGQVPLKCYFLTLGIDVQLHGCYWGVFGWGHMGRSWLIDWGYNRRYISSTDDFADDDIEDPTFPNIASDLDQLRTSCLNRKYPMFGGKDSPYGYKYMSIKGAAIDANYRVHSVHRFIHQLNDPRLLATRGDNTVSMKDRFRKTMIDKAKDGKQLDFKRELWGLAVSHYKTDIYDRLSLDAGSQQALSFPSGMVGIGQDFLRQLLNEKHAETVNKRTNEKQMGWVEINNRIGSHGLDTWVYGFARAEILLAKLGMTWDSNTWRRKAPIQQPPQQIAREYQSS